MTIHRAKGLEFEIVCVADLGRGPWSFAPLIRVGRDGRLGLRLSRPGTERPWATLAHDEIGEQQKAAGVAEERRLFYVAMTRARERLILSGRPSSTATRGRTARGRRSGGSAPAVVPDIRARVDQGSGVADGVRFSFVTEDVEEKPFRRSEGIAPALVDVGELEPPRPSQARPDPGVRSLSYTSLATYQRCGYRFYVERVLGVPGPRSRRAAGAPPVVER